MTGRPLTAAERALWDRVVETVDPLRPTEGASAPKPATDSKRPAAAPPPAPAPVPLNRQRPLPTTGGLDGHWDRRLKRGGVAPDVTVDLHGHTLSSAHGRLDSALELSIAAGHRAILLITGKPRDTAERQQSGRGAIRAAVTDWLAASRHASSIAAVRGAHPRHGGNGALYIILKRRRG